MANTWYTSNNGNMAPQALSSMAVQLPDLHALLVRARTLYVGSEWIGGPAGNCVVGWSSA